MANDKWSGNNPWLGLAPYTEGTPLYGRTQESAVLSEIIKDNIATIVYGKSGIGKSSLLSAGISPMLRSEQFIPVPLRLVHNTDVSYVEQIENRVRELVDCKDELPEIVPDLGLWDFFHRNTFTKDGVSCQPVIILDQFEEIYTLTDVEHKPEIITLFTELASLLNDIKPDAVLAAESSFSGGTTASASSGDDFSFELSTGTSFAYNETVNFRFVICLREDKLYLLERNSANIPSIKTNRYNLQALSPESALEVITCPRPDLFTTGEATAIVDKLADMGDEGIRTVDPAILSLLLYRYYEKKGIVKKRDIINEYYIEATSSVRNKTMIYLEEHLASPAGVRYELPIDSVLSNGIKPQEIDELVENKIIRKNVHGQIVYIEFLHDRIGLIASQTLVRRKTKRLKQRIIFSISLTLCILLSFIVKLNLDVKKQIDINRQLQEELQNKYQNYGLHFFANDTITVEQQRAVDEILSSMAYISDSLMMSRFEVSTSQWYEILGKDYDRNQKDLPITNISFGEVLFYISKLNELTNVEFNLPTYEEWVFAAKGNEDYKYSGSNNPDDVAWYENNSGKEPHPSFGQKLPNGFGLFDMSGNVCEYTWGFDEEGSGVRICGGHYASPESDIEVTSYKVIEPDERSNSRGFRLVIRK